MTTYQLPGGRVVDLVTVTREAPRARSVEHGAPLFAETKALFEAGDVALVGEELGALPLSDFHTLRAILTHLGWVHEESVDLTCRNCGAPVSHRPCAALPLGPFADRELGDAELDVTLPFGVAHPVPDLGAVVLAPLTVDGAADLHAALPEPVFRLSPRLVRAMGVLSIDGEARPSLLARTLSRASPAAWSAVTALFLRAHYPPRLFSIASCPACGARNDVDAPYEREFEEGDFTGSSRASNAEPFPLFEVFDRVALALGRRILDEAGAPDVALVVEGGVAACDDGGEPLLGAYLPGYEGDMHAPSSSPEVTVYYRTFQAIWDEEGPFDWRAELDETLAHEVSHHLAYLRGDDPVDDEERREITREASRVVGERAQMRGEIRAFNADVMGFVRRTWPIWLVLVAVMLAVTCLEVR